MHLPNPPLTVTTALAHERLYPRVTALLKQVERSASRHPAHPVPAATRDLARTLFAEARKILGREAMRTAGSASADLSALAVALGQLVAMLEAFEAANSGFSAKARCTLWRVEGPPLPVTRLLPPGVEVAAVTAESAAASKARQQLGRLIMARHSAGYDAGYRDALEGRPPSSRYAEDAWATLVKAAGNDEVARRRDLKRRYGTSSPPPHLMPVGAEPGEWSRLQVARFEARKAALARASAATEADHE